MDIKALRYFVHVADTLSFNRAAERLHISQPVVTRAIAQLEHTVGNKLFERTTRRVALTPAGAVLLKEARPLMAHVESVQRMVRHAVAGNRSRFAVGATSIAMQTVTPPILRRFQQAYPDIELEVRELPSHAQVEALLSAEIDVGFLLAPVSHPAINIRPIYRERMKLAVPDHHPQAPVGRQGTAVPLAAFAGDNFIIPSRRQNSTIYDEIVKTCEGAGFRPRLKECDENQTCLGLAKAGLGVIFITGQLTDCATEGLVVLDIEDPTPVLELALAWRDDDPSPCLSVFRELHGVEALSLS
jgi:DNA-binding transcriptional LysR family regulator